MPSGETGFTHVVGGLTPCQSARAVCHDMFSPSCMALIRISDRSCEVDEFLTFIEVAFSEYLWRSVGTTEWDEYALTLCDGYTRSINFHWMIVPIKSHANHLRAIVSRQLFVISHNERFPTVLHLYRPTCSDVQTSIHSQAFGFMPS